MRARSRCRERWYARRPGPSTATRYWAGGTGRSSSRLRTIRWSSKGPSSSRESFRRWRCSMMGFQSPIRLRPLVLFAALLPLVESEQLRAGGKNGVAPNTVSLPSGPGSIEGLGESFEPMLQTGTAKYEVPIALPPGVAGHTPSLSLNYDAGFANGPAGFGWTFGPGAIKRQSERGVPRYREPEEDDTFLGPSGMDLVELQNGFFLSRIEGNFLRYGRVWPERTEHPQRFYWEVHSKDGTKYEYGLTDAGRVAQPAAESPTSRERIYAWLLERSTDVHGNVIEYRYDDQGWQEDRGKYLIEVRYGPGPPPWGAYYFVVFEYEDRPDWFTDARSGFLVKIRKRLTRIHVAIQGAPEEATRNCKAGDFNRDGTSDRLIRSYELLYTVSNGGQVLAGHSHWTLLSQITVVGSDGESSLPPLVLRYGLSDENFFEEKELDAAGGLIYSKGEPLIVNDRRNVELLDVNSDGLPDLIHTEADEHFAYLNRGVREFAVAAAAVVCPPPGP